MALTGVEAMTEFSPATNRRGFLSACSQLGLSILAVPWVTRAENPKALVAEVKTISTQPEYYNGWPTVARRKNGDLWIAWSGGRELHVCPFGQVQVMVSRDEGATWSWPRVLLDGPIDNRDAGVLETQKGTLLVTTFSSLAYEESFKSGKVFTQMSGKGWESGAISEARKQKWAAAHARATDAERRGELGQWCVRSDDGGLSWSARIRTIVNSPHGPIALSDGRLLYAGKELWTAEKRVGVAESLDDGLTWRWISEIPLRKGDIQAYHELHAVEAADGKLVVQIRNHNTEHKGWTLQTESADGGHSWTEPRPICLGLPSHLLKLRDGRLLMTYGYRHQPHGNRARLSTDHGATWSEEMVISDDGANGDLGYPSTVELADGTLLSVWYQSNPETGRAVLRQAKWKVA